MRFLREYLIIVIVMALFLYLPACWFQGSCHPWNWLWMCWAFLVGDFYGVVRGSRGVRK